MKGIIVEIKGKKVIALQKDGSFVKCANPSGARIGEEIVIPEVSAFTLKWESWVPMAAAAAILIAFIGLTDGIVGIGGLTPISVIDEDPVPLGQPNVSPEIISPSAQIRLSEGYILTVWLSEDRSTVSWYSDTPLSHIILRCDNQEYIYDVGDYLGVTGLAVPNQETIREIGVLANPGSETPSEETPYLVLRDGNQLPALEADRQDANYDDEETLWLLREAVIDRR